MSTRNSLGAVLRKQVGKDAKAILKKIDKMLKHDVPRPKVEKILSAELAAHTKKQIRHVCDPVVEIEGR